MDLSRMILDYADKCGQFNFREICRYCREQEKMSVVLRDEAISACLRRLKSGGYIWNKRDLWYLRKQR